MLHIFYSGIKSASTPHLGDALFKKCSENIPSRISIILKTIVKDIFSTGHFSFGYQMYTSLLLNISVYSTIMCMCAYYTIFYSENISVLQSSCQQF